MQEEENHENDQHDGLKEGVHYFVNRRLHEARRVERHFVFDAGREALGQCFHRRVNLLRHIKRIGARLLIDGDHGRLLAIVNIT